MMAALIALESPYSLFQLSHSEGEAKVMIRLGGDVYNSERKGRCPQDWLSARKWFALRKKTINIHVHKTSFAGMNPVLPLLS